MSHESFTEKCAITAPLRRLSYIRVALRNDRCEHSEPPTLHLGIAGCLNQNGPGHLIHPVQRFELSEMLFDVVHDPVYVVGDSCKHARETRFGTSHTERHDSGEIERAVHSVH